jgi:hypothetical protein
MENGGAETRSRAVKLLLLIGLLSILGIAALYTFYTPRFPGANDFYSRWVGGCALLREGLNPYSETVTRRIQEGMYGRLALPGEDQVAFAYPLYSLLFFWPLCFTNNYALVQAIWLWVLLMGLIGAVALWMRVIKWQPNIWLLTSTVLWSVLLYHNFRALILGQFAVIVLLALVAALWAMQHSRDGLAGLLLALSTVKPQMVYLAIPWLLLWAAGQRRWRLWWSFGLSMASLILGSMILLPSWIPDFVRQALTYPSYTVYGSLTQMMVECSLGSFFSARTLSSITLILQIGLALGWLALGRRLWRGTWEQMLWMLGLLLLLTNFLTPRIATTNYLMLTPWALWAFFSIPASREGRGVLAVILLEIISIIGLWAMFLTTVEGDFERAPMYFPFPIAMALLLAWLFRIDWFNLKD